MYLFVGHETSYAFRVGALYTQTINFEAASDSEIGVEDDSRQASQNVDSRYSDAGQATQLSSSPQQQFSSTSTPHIFSRHTTSVTQSRHRSTLPQLLQLQHIFYLLIFSYFIMLFFVAVLG